MTLSALRGGAHEGVHCRGDHVVAVVVSLVLLASGILIFAILRTEDDDEEADDA